MDVLYLLVFTTLTVLMAKATHSEDQLYFTNLLDIQLFVDNNTQSVITNLELAEALDCNICDRLIYWVDSAGKIKRGSPGNDSSVQVIVEDDLVEPYGLAVDWKGNNVYFSQRRGPAPGHRDQGRIEVVKCDGQYRKVLRDKLFHPGPIALDVQRGYLYYADIIDIFVADSDGQNHQHILADFGSTVDFETGIIGLAVDTELNILYWTTALENGQPSTIKWLNLTEWRQNQSLPTPPTFPTVHTVANTMGSNPHGIFLVHDTLYWTETKLCSSDDISSVTVLRDGAIYSLNLESNVARRLISSSSISPQDLSSFTDMPEDSTGCADANGGCSHFCFTVPDGQSGTTSRCGCPTGIRPRISNNTCPDIPSNFLLFLQNATTVDHVRTEIRIVSLDIESTFIDVLVPINISAISAYIAYDTVMHTVYWTQTSPPAIMRARLDGTGVEPFITTSIRTPEGIAVEPYTQILFWVDSTLDRIEVASLDDNRHRKVLIDGLDHPQGIALNLAMSKIYWTDLDASDARVERAFMDGTRSEPPLQTELEVKIPTDIAVDPLTHIVFWADIDRNRDHIIRYDESTGTYRELDIIGLAEVRGLTVYGDFLYWSDLESSASIAKASKEDGSTRSILFMDYDGVMGLLAVNGSEEAVDTREPCRLSSENCDDLCLLTQDGFTCACRDFFILDDDLESCVDPPPLVLIATERALIPYQFDTNGRLDRLGSSDQWNLQALAVAVDIRKDMLYWISATDNLIYRQNVSADYTQPVQEKVISCCLETPEDLAVDWFGQNIYWTDSTRGTIEVAKLDGRGRTVLAEDLDHPTHIALDPLRGDLYWAPKRNVEIYRIKMNGQNLSSENPSCEPFWREDTEGSIFGMVLNYGDQASDVLYLGIDADDTSDIRVEQFEPGNPNSAPFTTITDLTQTPLHLQTFRDQTLYYHIAATAGGEIVQNIIKELTDSTDNSILTDFALGNFSDFVVAHHSLQPGTHECSINNGGCMGRETLCLVQDQFQGSCECPPWRIKNVVETLQGDTHENCISTDAFVLIATSSDVHYLPVPPTAAVGRATPRPLPAGPFHDIRAISYDPINDSVLWLDREEVLRSVTVNASFSWDILPLSNLIPSSLAYDWQGGHIFVTEEAGFQIELLTVNGEGVGSLLEDIQSPSDVVFDVDSRTLYWVDHGRHINSLSLDDGTRQTLTDPRQIQQLSLAANCLFWINNDTRTSEVTISKYNTTSRATETLETLTGHAVTFLTAVPVNDQPYVFWYNTSDSSIYFHNGTTSAVYVQWTTTEDIVAFAGFVNASTTFSSLPCLETPRPCSHICLRQSGGSVSCDCPVYRTLQDDQETCSDVLCDPRFVPCRGVFDECISSYYVCDSIRHCPDGSDEVDCNCNTDEQFVCGSNTSTCLPKSKQCDGIVDCLNSEDEASGFCCSDSEFGCYDDDGIYRCLDRDLNMCDGYSDCESGEDEENCPVTTTRPTPSSPDPSVGENLITYITIGSVCTIAVLIVLIFCLCLAIRTIRKHKKDYSPGAARITSNHHSASAKFSNSPQPSGPRSDSMSVFSEMSMGTHSTNLGPYGSNLSPSADGTCKRYSAGGLSTDPSNPPPSPITIQPSFAMTELGDAFSAVSQGYSEFNYPRAPNPSLDYDEMSSASLSVSQRRIPAALNGGIHHDPRMYGGRGGGVVVRRGNPLMNNHHHHERYYQPPGLHNHHPHNAHPHPSHSHSHTQSSQHYHQNHHRLHQNHHFPFQAQDQVEIESTISMTTAHTDNPYDSIHDVTPPGRPPSLATEISEHYNHIPTSPVSLASDDYEEEFLHQT